MGLDTQIFRKALVEDEVYQPDKLKQAVIVRFDYGLDGLDPLHNLESELIQVIAEKGVGEYDGHEIAMDDSDGILFMYGRNAEALFKAVLPTLGLQSL